MAKTKTQTTDAALEAKKSKVRGAKYITADATQMHLRIGEIRNDVLVLKNGGLRAVLETNSINFSLKSEEEQNSIIYSYQAFLNTLEFPIQIVVRSNKLDLDNYLADLRKKGDVQQNPLLQKQTYDYIEYIQRLLEYANIMEKKFYVVVPFDPYRAQKKTLVQKVLERLNLRDKASDVIQRNNEFERLIKGLNQRVNIVASGLENCGMKTKQMTTSELIQLFYESHNPLTARNQKLTSVEEYKLDS